MMLTLGERERGAPASAISPLPSPARGRLIREADGGTRCAEQSDDLGRTKQNAGDKDDLYQPPREIFEFAA
jgi:hypothetical protein